MELKSLFTILATTAVLATPALAQDKTGPNVDKAGTGTRGGVATLALAQELYALGLANKDALTVLTAAKLAASVDIKEVEQNKTTKGDEVAGQEDGTDVPVDAATMLASARDLAGEDEVMVGLIEDAEAKNFFAAAQAAQPTEPLPEKVAISLPGVSINVSGDDNAEGGRGKVRINAGPVNIAVDGDSADGSSGAVRIGGVNADAAAKFIEGIDHLSPEVKQQMRDKLGLGSPS